MDEDSDTELDRTTKSFNQSIKLNEYNNLTNPSFIDANNPFLRAPFHRSPANKQTSASLSINLDRIPTTINTSLFDPDSIVIGKKASAFVPYQKQERNSDNHGNFIFLSNRFQMYINRRDSQISYIRLSAVTRKEY